MATNVGGRFKFTDPVHLGLKFPGHKVSPGPDTTLGVTNIEAFVGGTSLPALDKGFQQGIIVADTTTGAKPGLSGSGTNQTLFVQRMTLFGGKYEVVDTNTVSGNAAQIKLGSGRQTVVGARHDTLIGGTGTQSIDGARSRESIVGGTHTYTAVGGLHDTIRGNSNSTSITAGHIVATASVESIQLSKHGNYTVKAGAADTISAVPGSAKIDIISSHGDSINLTRNTGKDTINSSGWDTIIAGTGHETIRGGPGDRMGVGKAGAAGGTLVMSHRSTTAGAIRFGTNDTVHSTKYNTKLKTATRESSVSGTSSAHVTVTNFRLGTDSLFYKGETATLNKDIVLTAHNTATGAVIVLPDGTTMTLLGVTATELQHQNSLGHLFKT